MSFFVDQLRRLGLPLATVGLAACGGDEPPPANAGQPAAGPSAPAVRFVDATAGSGLDGFVQVNGRPDKPTIVESFGGGVALVDVDGDGDLDAYLTNGGMLDGSAPDARDALMLNDGSGVFTDATDAKGVDGRGWTTGVEAGDVNGDGRIDLFLTAYGRDTLLVQRVDGTFEDRTKASGLADGSWSTGAAFLDVDRDGDLDLYVGRHIDLDLEEIESTRKRERWMEQEVYYGPRGLVGLPDRFYLNDGAGVFTDATAAFGVDVHALYAFEVVAFDADGDGWTDVYVANDSMPNLFFRNVEGQRFEEQGVLSGAALSSSGGPQAGMGVAVGDADGDADADLFVTNFSEDHYTLYVNRGDGRFSDRTMRGRLVAPTRAFLGWSTGFHDLDLDGDQDLWCVNGHVFPQADAAGSGMGYAQRAQVFINGGDARFREAEDAGGGLDVPRTSRGAAAGDVDGDGDVDLLIGNIDGSPTLLVNRTDRALAPVTVTLEDRHVGARLEATFSGSSQVRWLGSGAGFLSCAGAQAVFAVPDGAAAGDLVVLRADGSREAYEGLLAPGVHVTIPAGGGAPRTAPIEDAR